MCGNVLASSLVLKVFAAIKLAFLVLLYSVWLAFFTHKFFEIRRQLLIQISPFYFRMISFSALSHQKLWHAKESTKVQ